MSGEKPLAVTGGTGFVGQALLDLTDERCLLVNALTRKPRQDKHSRVEWVTGDLDNMAALEHLMAGANAVIHIAGLTNTHDPTERDRYSECHSGDEASAHEAAGIRLITLRA